MNNVHCSYLDKLGDCNFLNVVVTRRVPIIENTNIEITLTTKCRTFVVPGQECIQEIRFT